MASLAALQVELSLQSAQFKKGMDQANRQMGRMQKQSKRTNTALGGIQKSMSVVGTAAVSFAASLGVAFSARTIKGIFEANNALQDLSDRIDVSAEKIQSLRFAFAETGVSASTLDSSMERFAKRVGEADAGTGILLKTFNRLDITTRDVNGNMKSTSALLSEVAEAVKGAESAQEKLNISFAAFGREGLKLTNTLDLGVASMEKLEQTARDTGAVIGNDLVKATAAANTAMNQLLATWGTQFNNAVSSSFIAVREFFGFFDTQQGAEKALKDLLKEQSLLNKQLESGNALITARANIRLGIVDDEILNISKQLIDLEKNADASSKSLDNFLAPKTANISALSTSVEKVNQVMTEADRRAKFFSDALVSVERSALDAQYSQEILAEKVQILSTLWEGGNISLMVYVEEMNKLRDVIKEVEETDLAINFEETNQLLGQMVDNMNSFVKGGVNDLVDSLFEAKQSFGDFARTFVLEMTKMIAKQLLFNALQSALGGSGSSLFSGFGGSVSGAVPSGDFSIASPGAFSFPSNSANSAQSSPVSVVVNNNAAANVDVRETQSSDGSTGIQVYIENAVKAGIKKGRMDDAFTQSYGIKRRGF